MSHSLCNNLAQTHQRRGVALMLVMVAILVTGSMAVAYFGSRDNSIAISANVSAASRARIVAESGLDIAISILETNAQWRTNHIDGVILQDYQLGAGTITITIIDNQTEQPPTDSTEEVLISVISTVDGRTQITEASATIFPEDNEIDVDYSEFAIFAQNRISVRGSSSVQNWIASPMTSHQEIQIGTLSTNPMSIQYNSNARAINLHIPEYASSMVSAKALNTTKFTDNLPFLRPPPPPTHTDQLMLNKKNVEDSLSSWAAWFASGISNSFHGLVEQPTKIIAGSYEIDSLSLSSNQPIEINGDVIITVEDFSMTHANIILAEDATLTLHITGSVSINSSYIGDVNKSIQSWMDPSRIQLYGHDNENWNVSGHSTIKGEIYAPKSNIELRGASTICGRIAGNNVTLRGASRVLYDPTLDNGGFADANSAIYDSNGGLIEEVRQLTHLDPMILDTLEQSLSSYTMNSDLLSSNSLRSLTDWRIEPTARPHEVIYMLVVYGVDARSWETRARHARQNHNNSHTGSVLGSKKLDHEHPINYDNVSAVHYK